MAGNGIDIDRIVDYAAEYSAAIRGARASGGSIYGFCPFHDDKKNSFSADIKTGQWKCFSGCGGGNFISFWARKENVGTKEAYKEILKKYGISEQVRQEKPKEERPAPYGVEQYCEEKKLPLALILGECRAETKIWPPGQSWKAGRSCMRLPYMGTDGKVVCIRERYAGKEFRWGRGASGNICLYGLWRLPGIREGKMAVLVEGESDCHSLWAMDIPALGVPGASMFKAEHARQLAGLDIYIHAEPDDGGAEFTRLVMQTLRAAKHDGKIFVWSCKELGAKDPSELYLKKGADEAAWLIKEQLKAAEEAGTNPDDEASRLVQAKGFLFSDGGLFYSDPKSGAMVNFCRTPIVISRRLQSIEDEEEKVVISYKRDGRWKEAAYLRSTIFTARGVSVLSDLGCTVTSENSRQLVKFFAALEAENLDIIPKVGSTQTLGWKPGRRFAPWHSGDMYLDIDSEQKAMIRGYRKKGSLAGWTAAMKGPRKGHIFRFVLAAGLAPPLLKIAGVRSFMVYDWGGSRGGKTAALKAALSAWGDPGRLMMSFNATQAGIERAASLYCDLPLGLDERQSAGGKQEFLETIIYMLSEEKGRLRSDKGGGLQKTYQWRSIAIATGEEPIAIATSKTGVSTRALEIYGAPFSDEGEAAKMHRAAANDYGYAGPLFAGKLIAMTDAEIKDDFERFSAYVDEVGEGKNGAHTASIALIALADYYAGMWIFEDNPETAEKKSKEMAADILVNQIEMNESDVNESAVQFITDWVISNAAYFKDDCNGQRLGIIEGGSAFIFPSLMSGALEKAGYSPKKVREYMAENGYIRTFRDPSKGCDRRTALKRLDGKPVRLVEFLLSKVVAGDKEKQQELEGLEGFTDAGQDDELPFE